MEYSNFTKALKKLFERISSAYLGQAHSQSGTKIQLKQDGTPVGDLDRYSLKAMRELVSLYFPNDHTIGEEDENDDEKIQQIIRCQNQPQWTIDGLDGTGNFRMRTNSYGAIVSRRLGSEILYMAAFRPVDHALYGNRFFFAELGHGAWQWCEEHNEYHSLKTAMVGELERLVVLLEGSSKKFFKSPIRELGLAITTRPSLSSCIAATTVAIGKASALVTVENKPWDNWPSWLLVKEAGGVVTNWQGNVLTPENCGNMIAAANYKDHALILKLLSRP